LIRTVESATCYRARFDSQAFCQPRKIDDHASHGVSGADLLAVVPRPNDKLHTPCIDAGHLGLSDDTRPDGVGARWRMSTRVPTRSRRPPGMGLMALSAAFSITMIITGVASTAAALKSLNRLARMLGLDDQPEVAFGTHGYRSHAFPHQSDCTGGSPSKRTSPPKRLWKVLFTGRYSGRCRLSDVNDPRHLWEAIDHPLSCQKSQVHRGEADREYVPKTHSYPRQCRSTRYSQADILDGEGFFVIGRPPLLTGGEWPGTARAAAPEATDCAAVIR